MATITAPTNPAPTAPTIFESSPAVGPFVAPATTSVSPTSPTTVAPPAVSTSTAAINDINQKTVDHQNITQSMDQQAANNLAVKQKLEAERAASAAAIQEQANKDRELSIKASTPTSKDVADNLLSRYGETQDTTPLLTSMSATQQSALSDEAQRLGRQLTYDEVKNFKDTGSISGATAPAVQDYTKQILDNSTKIDEAYKTYQTQVDQIRNGTFPLTSAQQAQIDSIKQYFERAKAQQQLANKNYEGGITQLGIVSGRNRYAPELALGEIQNSISAGIQKIADLDAKAASTVAQMTEAFQTRNYEMIGDSFDKFNKYMSQKNDTITKLQDSAQKHLESSQQLALQYEKLNQDQNQFEVTSKLNSDKFSYEQKKDVIDQALTEKKITADQANQLNDYNLKLRQLEQGKYVVTQDAFGNPIAFNTKLGQFDRSAIPQSAASSGVFAPQNAAYRDALQQAMFKVPEKQQKQTMGQLNNLLEQGDMKRVQELIVNSAIKNLPTDQQNQVMARLQAVSALNDIRTMLNIYVKKSGDTGILSGNLEKAAQKIGRTTDPELAKIGSQIAQTLQVYRKGMTGVAFSPAEAADYAKIFPDITNIDKLNATKIDSLLESFNRQQKVTLGVQLGESNYNQIFGAGVKYTSLNDLYNNRPEFQAQIEDTMNKNPNLKPEEILQIYEGYEPSFNKPLSTGENGSEVKKTAEAIGQFESGGNYKAVGPVTSSGDRAYGKYQIMGNNIASWAKEALGYTVDVQKFLGNPVLQDAVAIYKMGQYLKQHGNLEDVASMWFSGRPLSQAGNAKDVIGTTVPSYVKNVRAIYDKLG